MASSEQASAPEDVVQAVRGQGGLGTTGLGNSRAGRVGLVGRPANGRPSAIFRREDHSGMHGSLQ